MNIISSMVGFALANVHDLTAEEESNWLFSVAPQDPPMSQAEPIKGAFIYAFQVVGGGQPQLFSEYAADSDGNLSRCLGDVRRANLEEEPGLDPLGSFIDCLPDTVSGSQVEYYFFATRVRLSMPAIEKLEKQRPAVVPVFSVQAENACHTDSARVKLVPVIEPLFIATDLNTYYLVEADVLINNTTIHNGLPASKRTLLEERQNIIVVAKVLRSLLEHPEGSKLKQCFADGSGQNVRDHLDARVRWEQSLRKEQERRGNLLCRFLCSELMAFTEELYKVQESEHFPELLRAMSHACCRLSASKVGRSMFDAWLSKQAPYWFATYVFPSADTNDILPQVVRKGIGFIASLWNDLAENLVKIYENKFPEEFNLAAKKLTKLELVKFEQITGYIEVGYGRQVPVVTRGHMHISVPPDLNARLSAEFSDKVIVSKVLENLEKFAEAANLVSAVLDIWEVSNEGAPKDEWGDRAKAFLNLLGSALDTWTAFKTFGQFGELGLARISRLSSALDAVLAGWEAYELNELGDEGGASGNALVAAGSLVSLAGTLVTAKAAATVAAAEATGGAAAATGGAAAASASGLAFGAALGVAGVLIVIAGMAVVRATKDSPLEMFIKHCYFGKLHGKGDVGQPWSAGNFSEWSNGADGARAQVIALYNIVLSFAVQGYKGGQASALDAGVRIYHPPLNSRSIIHLYYDGVWTLNKPGFGGEVKRLGGECRVTLNSSKKENRIVFRNPEKHFEEIRAVAFGMDDAHLSVIDVVFHPKVLENHTPALRLWEFNLTVLIDINGDASVLVPSPESLRVVLWEGGKIRREPIGSIG